MAKASTLAVASTTLPEAAYDEYGACEYADKPNIYRTTHFEPLGTVTDWPEATVIGPTDIADDPLGIE